MSNKPAVAAEALALLLSRRSNSLLTAPGPGAQDLDLILQAAARAPDHASLRPWRFTLIEGDAIARLADFAIAAVKAGGDPRMTPEKEHAVRAWLAQVPLVIALGHEIHHDHPKAPEWEQLAAASAAVMNMLNAAHFLGYGAFWSTGLGTAVEEVQEGLGFDPLSYRFMGYLVIGTPAVPAQSINRPAPPAYVTRWTGPAGQ